MAYSFYEGQVQNITVHQKNMMMKYNYTGESEYLPFKNEKKKNHWLLFSKLVVDVDD